jgi:hypothetical protein
MIKQMIEPITRLLQTAFAKVLFRISSSNNFMTIHVTKNMPTLAPTKIILLTIPLFTGG